MCSLWSSLLTGIWRLFGVYVNSFDLTSIVYGGYWLIIFFNHLTPSKPVAPLGLSDLQGVEKNENILLKKIGEKNNVGTQFKKIEDGD